MGPHDRPLTRRDVVVAGHTGDVETIMAAYDSADGRVRAAAVAALDRCRALSDERLLAATGDPDPAVRRRVLDAAARRPGSGVDVRALADDGDSLVAETACWALGEQDPPHPQAVSTLSRVAREHPEHIVREAAVAALGSLGHPDGLDAVIASLDERATIRRRAVLALAAFDDERADAALRRCLDDRDRQVRQAAEDLLAE